MTTEPANGPAEESKEGWPQQAKGAVIGGVRNMGFSLAGGYLARLMQKQRWTPDELEAMLQHHYPIWRDLLATVPAGERTQWRLLFKKVAQSWGRREYWQILKAPALHTKPLKPLTLCLTRPGNFDEFCRAMEDLKQWLLTGRLPEVPEPPAPSA